MDKDPVNVWLEKARLIGSIVILIATVGTTSVAFLYATFHTNSSAAADKSFFETRLDRMEKKIDRLIELNSE